MMEEHYIDITDYYCLDKDDDYKSDESEEIVLDDRNVDHNSR
jgi:hypothetical protein